jgi:uncharacterized membrane protein YfcA
MDLDAATLALLASAFLVAAALYTSVGHGGASAYLAIMALFSLPQEVMKPTALVLNILAASVGAWRFIRAGRFDWPLFWPIALGAAPFAFLGGALHLPEAFYRPLLGGVLLFAAVRIAWPDVRTREAEPKRPPALASGAAGAGMGLLAGLTGTGGGIFLSPLMIFFNWTRVQNTAGIAASFIVLNSAAGLAGNVASMRMLPGFLPVLVGAVAVGALTGAWLGVSRYSTLALRRALALVMLIAGLKLVFT